MKFFYTIVIILLHTVIFAQVADTATISLDSVIIRVYEQTRKLTETPAAINSLDKRTFERFSPTSLVNAVNTTAGVRLEERSPGSYRFNIRGSSLRSPFGVRNVKIYYNDIPITDPSGNTYFNNFGYYNISSLQIIKGPGSSVYGAGTGGVVLMESLNEEKIPPVTAEYTIGSYGLQNAFAAVSLGDSASINRVSFQHQQSDGYRSHSALERNILSWNGRFQTSKGNIFKTTFLYSYLSYQTPGALTKREYDSNPATSRPAGGGFPSAEAAKASITQKTYLAGLSYTHRFSGAVSNTTVAYGMFTELRNPAIRNYGMNADPHVGGRTSFTYAKSLGENYIRFNAGAELQEQFSTISIYKNRNGEADTLQTLDDGRIRQSLVFLQASFSRRGWELTTGGSLNYLNLRFRRSVPAPLPLQQRKFSNEVAPRVALSKKWKSILLYTSIAKGFSPPTSSELLPSGSAINLSLNPEKGTNYDIGFRGSFEKLSFDINAFMFSLKNTIVQRRDAGGGEYFINAGATSQKGIETAINYPLLQRFSFLKQSNFWVTHTYHHFRYKDFKQLTNDFSGNALPGVAPHTVSAGFETITKTGLSAMVNYYYSDKIPLGDANTEFADAYSLLHVKVGYDKAFGKNWGCRLNIGVENLLDTKYSLGNDVNAFGGRFYNAAPRRNYYASLQISVL